MSQPPAGAPAQPSIAEALAWAAARLESFHASARLDAEVLLAHVLGRPRSHFWTWPEQRLAPEPRREFRRLVAERERGVPVAYLTGRREFWSLDLRVTSATLIPRPETERLVELSLALASRGARWTIADLGTGSGAIALSIASERAHCRVLGTDRSAAALAVARTNARRLDIRNVAWLQGDWLAPLADQSLDLVVANPPYVPAADPHLDLGDAAFEPRGALVAGDTGLADLRIIAASAPRCLRPGGWLLLEHGCDQGPAVEALLGAQGFAEVSDEPDFAGHGRVTRGRIRGSGSRAER